MGAVVDLGLEHVQADDILAFLDHLESERKNSVTTRNARLAAIHAFARFLATRNPEHVEEAQRLLAVPIKRGPSRAVDYLEGDEIGAMLEAISSSQRRDHVRDRALLLTLFNTGARVQELLDIRVGDLQLDRPTFVRLRGKGRKERLCPLWPETTTALQAMLHISHVSPEDSKPIFRNHRGEPMTRFGVRYLMRQYADEHGRQRQLWPPSAFILTPVAIARRFISSGPGWISLRSAIGWGTRVSKRRTVTQRSI